MKTTLLIARHGNTFTADQTPTRVGARTDLPLVETGREQARKLGRYLKENNLLPDRVLTSELKRTQETAQIAMAEMGINAEIHPLAIFNEIDYGPDENKTEEEVIARLGSDALKNWDEDALVPDGWLVNPEEIIRNWIDFANELEIGTTTLVITSNGIARFAPHILAEGFAAFSARQKIKISTGGLCHFEKIAADWTVKGWNVRPQGLI